MFRLYHIEFYVPALDCKKHYLNIYFQDEANSQLNCVCQHYTKLWSVLQPLYVSNSSNLSFSWKAGSNLDMLGVFYKVYNVSSQVVLEESGNTQVCTLKQMSVSAKCIFIMILLISRRFCIIQV